MVKEDDTMNASNIFTRRVIFASTEALAQDAAKRAAKALGGRWAVEKLESKTGRVQWIAAPQEFKAGSYDLDEASPKFCSSERDDAYRGPEHNTVETKRPASEPTKSERIKREFTTTDRAEALSMARTLFGSVKTVDGKYLVTWFEKSAPISTEDLPF